MADAICPCGREVIQTRASGRPRKHCLVCRPPVHVSKPAVKRHCARDGCDSQFSTTTKKKKYCSLSCREEAHWLIAPRLPCVVCGLPTGHRRTDSRAKRPTCKDCKIPAEPRSLPSVTQWTCQRCGTKRLRKPTKGQRPRYCSEACQERSAFDRRRARMIGAFVEDVNRNEVFLADGFVCHLCGRRTDKTKSAPHPMAPTVDHIIPLSKGGLHERTNCRTAHLRCNSAKQDRGGGEQFILL